MSGPAAISAVGSTRWNLVLLCLLTGVVGADGAGEVRIETSAGTHHVMVEVPEGVFEMGHSAGNRGNPSHEVTLDAYYIDKYVVSNAQYDAFVDVTGHDSPEFGTWYASDEVLDELFGGDDHPVVGGSWFDALEYCTWIGLRLPTEAEWEKAARGTDGRLYPWGNTEPTRQHANWGNYSSELDFWITDDSDGYQFTSPVDAYPLGVSPYGAYDMGGNVFQWVSDWRSSLPQTDQSNPQGPSEGTEKVMKGMHWYWYAGGSTLQASLRWFGPPERRDDHTGFR